MVILATRKKEIGTNPLLDANCTFDANKEREFSIKIARCNWTEDMTYGNLVYVPDTEYGGIIGSVLTDTTLDYVELKGYTWRGRMNTKVISPPSGSNYKTVSGELNTVLKKLIEPEFGGLYVVSSADTGVSVSNYQFDRYCTLLDGITKMLQTVGYRMDIRHKREQSVPGYVLVSAVPIVDYSDVIELSKDSGLNYTMEDKRDGVNHLIVTGKGEMQDRNVFHLYVWPSGAIKKTQYYKGLDEIVEVYENTSTETDELENQSRKKLQEVCSKKTFGMDVEKLGINVGIGDIVGGRDYLTGMYGTKPTAEWNTTLAEGTVLEGLEATEEIVEKNPDIIEQILARLDNVTEVPQEKISSAVEEYLQKNPVSVPTKLSDLQDDTTHRTVTDTEKESWDSKSDFSGNYNDLEGKPTIPTVPSTLPNPHKLTFAGAVTAEYDGSGAVTVTIPEASGGSSGTVRVEKGSTDTTVELEPNKLYIFPEMASLTYTLAEPADASVANEYHFVFKSGSTATELVHPSTVNVGNFSVDANKVYEISILEGLLTSQNWSVS